MFKRIQPDPPNRLAADKREKKSASRPADAHFHTNHKKNEEVKTKVSNNKRKRKEASL